MPEEITKKLDDNWDELPFEAFVRRQLISISNRLTTMEASQSELRTEVVERFVQVSRHVREVKDTLDETKGEVQKLDDKMTKITRQIRDLGDKVDIFVQEHLYLKRDVQDMQESLEQKH